MRFPLIARWAVPLVALVAALSAIAAARQGTGAPAPVAPGYPAPAAREPALGGSPTATPAPPYGVVRDPAFAALPGASARYGTYDGGAYRIEVPDNWNGGLVLYAHGYRGEGPDIFVSNVPIRRHLIEGGYAWAASSYRGNSYRPDWGVDDTLALRDLFIREFGEPRWTILYGTSMGGHVAIASLELHPGVYQGALPECGVLTGIGEIDYLAAYTTAAEYIAGVPLLDAPSAAAFTQLLRDRWLPAMGRPGSLTEKGRRFVSVARYLMGGADLPLADQGLADRYLANLMLVADPTLARSPSGRAVSTRAVVYRIDPSLGLSADELNANVRRIDPAPGSRSAADNPVFADFTGRITVPVLTLHTTGDAFVPFSLEQDYRRKTLAAGTDGLLVQRAIRRPRHCEFDTSEEARAFDDLIAWIERGVKPEGDDVLTPDLAALGLRWTGSLLPEDPAASR